MSILRVASEAGVSVATVSRAFNRPECVREETRRRVASAARRVDYRPNASARTLRTQRSRVLGVVLPTLLNPVFAECLQGIAEAAAAAGYSIVPMTTEYRLADERRAVDALRAAGVDGVVLVVSNPSTSVALRQLRAEGLRYVLAYNRHARHPCVSVDGIEALAAAVHRLAALGHRRIAMVSGERAASDRAQLRHEGFLQGMATAGLEPLPLIEVPFVEAAVDQIAAALRRPRRATALVGSNDLLAIRAMRAAHLCGLAVPHDLSVVGFDGITLGEDLTPALSTITQPNRDIGRRSIELLIGALAEGRELDAGSSVLLAHGFRVGESCGAAPH
ncbi:MAG: substrate-binding domain-containing protein [Caldimonas sp.]